MRLQPSEVFRNRAENIRDSTAARLAAAGVPGVLILVGGSSVDGAVTRGDVDLHLRVPPEDFTTTVDTLQAMLAVVHPEIWCPSLATFEVPAELPTGLAVTPVGSEHDTRFTRTWQLLRADPELLTGYNDVKLSSHDGDDYEERKSAFFDALLASRPY